MARVVRKTKREKFAQKASRSARQKSSQKSRPKRLLRRLKVQSKSKKISVVSAPSSAASSSWQLPPFAHWSEPWLPRSYNITKLVLMVRDPEWVFVYWDLDVQKRKWVEYLFSKGYARTVLRIYDVTNIDFNGANAHHQWDIDVQIEALEWYVNLGSPNRAFIADLGVVDGQGWFHCLARSNAIRMPRNGPSEVIDEEWMSLDFDEIYALSGGFRIGGASEQISSFAWATLFSPTASSFSSIKKKKIIPLSKKKKVL